MDMLLYSLSLPPTAWVSCTKNSAQRKWRKIKRKRAETFISCTVGSGEKLIKEEAENACARPHSGIRLSVINKVDNNSMKGDDDNERNITNNKTANSNKEMSIRHSGFSVPSPGYNCESGTMLINFRSSSDNVDGDGNNNNSTSGIRGLNNNSKILIGEEAEDVCVVYPPKENSRRIDIGKDDNNNNHNHNHNHNHDNKSKHNNNDNEILLKIQEADLCRMPN